MPRIEDPSLSGSAWAGAAGVAPFTLADGSAAAKQATRALLAWDARALYVRFECADRDAWGTLYRRNDPVYSEEAVEIFLAPGAEAPRRYLEIEISPLGTVFAAVIDNPTGRRADLVADTTWPCAGLQSQVGPGGANQDWWAALAIPWATLLAALDAGPAAAAAGDDPGRLSATGNDPDRQDAAHLDPVRQAAAHLDPGQEAAACHPLGDASDRRAVEAPPLLWRANLYRIERPRDGGAAEFSCWSPTFTNPPDFHRPERFGLLQLVRG